MRAAITAAVLACAATEAAAQAYPARPVRMVIPFAAGGSVDVLARLVAQKLSEGWGQQVVVDNRPGASGNLSAEIVARSAPDGHTIYLCATSFVVNPSLFPRLAWDPLRDFSPVRLLAQAQSVLVAHPSLRVRSVGELIAAARAKPGAIHYATTGSGSSGHLTMELFRSMAGIDLAHVPYKAVSQAQTDLIGGQVMLWFPTIPGMLPFIRAERVVALAVSGAQRTPILPSVPTLHEAGVPGFEATTWYAVMTPAGTRTEVLDRLGSALDGVLRQPDVQDRLGTQGIEPIGAPPERLAAHLRSEKDKWARVVKSAGIKID